LAHAAFTAPPQSEWQAFTSRYLSAEGRIIDTANDGISHSEGQGYGMFFAAHFGDRRRFDLIWEWTQANLSRPQDSLFMWRFDPHHRLMLEGLRLQIDHCGGGRGVTIDPHLHGHALAVGPEQGRIARGL
jgi:hypothetical protein